MYVALVTTILVAVVAPTWLTWWNSRIAAKQVKPNGGTSIADAINRIEATQQRTELKVDTQAALLELHAAEIKAIRTRVGYGYWTPPTTEEQ